MKKTSTLLSGEALVGFCGQMAMFLKAGCSVEEGLALLAEDEPGLEGLLEEVRHGCELAAAMEKQEGVPEYFLRMLHLGQETGRLEDVLQALAEHYRRELSLRRSLRDAVSYPALMLLMVLVILGLLLTQVLPLFEQAFAQLGAGLTGFSRVLLELGQVPPAAWVLPVLGSVLILGLLLRYGRRLPVLRRIHGKIALSRLTGALALGLSSGLSTHYALELAAELVPDKALSGKLAQARSLLDQGQDLAEVLRRTGILTGAGSRLALVGRRTGSLDAALAQISRDCREEADHAIDSAIAMIEPVMVFVLSALVALLLISVLTPMLGLLGAV